MDTDISHLRAHPEENATESLERAAAFASEGTEWCWKWVGFAIHHALYSFCLTALHHGNWEHVASSGRRDEDDGMKCWRGPGSEMPGRVSRIQKVNGGPAYRIVWDPVDDPFPSGNSATVKDRPFSKSKVIGFWTALARVQDGYHWMDRYVGSRPLVLTDDELESIVWLTSKVRNNLMHYLPHLNWIDTRSIRYTTAVAVKAVEFLVFESRSMGLPLDRQERVRQAINQLRSNI